MPGFLFFKEQTRFDYRGDFLFIPVNESYFSVCPTDTFRILYTIPSIEEKMLKISFTTNTEIVTTPQKKCLHFLKKEKAVLIKLRE